MHRRARRGIVRDIDYVDMFLDEVRHEIHSQPMPTTEESLVPILKPQFNRLKKTVKRK